MKTKIAIIGHFGGGKQFTDGQTVKTVALYNELKQVPNLKIEIVDTYYKSKRPILLLAKTIKELIWTKNIVVLLSQNGLRFYLPILCFASGILRTRVYHDVIGGNLSSYIDKYPKYEKYLNSFRLNYVETNLLKEELEERGIRNVEILPNFRRLSILNEKELKSKYDEPYTFCPYSRVIKEKGIEDAIYAVEACNAEAGRTVCRLDIYGPVGLDYQEEFNTVMKKATDAVRYCGEVPSARAIETLKDYYAVLFPTFWPSESQAGTISESFSAGVPVIATDWRCNHEMIRNGYNGMLYPSETVKTLKEGIFWIIGQKNQILEIKNNCLQSALYYQPDEHIKKMIETIGSR
ncbi:MAG: glycosyltransferase family 4 protein [Clostridiales bacterium]|nr:glycosyltransferase family 4 protein [Clostridiales bacterium]